MSASEPVPAAPAGRLRRAGRVLRSPSPWRVALDYTTLAVCAFVPMLASRPGVVTSDTKTYLYLDPGRYVQTAASLWTPSVGLGTVTHENIGYLLPMGPFYWFLAELHVPIWVAQRLWMGCLLYAAGAGALYLCRTIGLSGPGRYVCALAFMFTPYVLQYAGRISVILMPWAGLPWMIAFVILALRRGGWRYPALFALVVALVSGINASSIIYVGIAPVLWLPYAVVVAREATWRRVWGVAWKTGLLCILVSLWWARRPPDRGGLRGQRPQVHGDGAGHVEPPRWPPRSSGASATGTSTAPTGWGRGRRRWSPTPRTSPSSSSASRSPPSASWPPPSPVGATGPTSSSSPWWAWSSPSGPTPTATRRVWAR